jgi:hypothetical protein
LLAGTTASPVADACFTIDALFSASSRLMRASSRSINCRIWRISSSSSALSLPSLALLLAAMPPFLSILPGPETLPATPNCTCAQVGACAIATAPDGRTKANPSAMHRSKDLFTSPRLTFSPIDFIKDEAACLTVSCRHYGEFQLRQESQDSKRPKYFAR